MIFGFREKPFLVLFLTKTNMHIALFLFLIFLFVKTDNSIAATDGVLGPTSAATKTITISVGSQVQVTGTEDYIIDWTIGDGDLVNNDELCIYSNANGEFNITIDSLNGNNSFLLKSGNVTVGFSIFLTMGSGGTPETGTQITENESKTFTGADSNNETCSGGTNVTMSIVINQNDLGAIVTNEIITLTDVLTITVAPGAAN